MTYNQFCTLTGGEKVIVNKMIPDKNLQGKVGIVSRTSLFSYYVWVIFEDNEQKVVEHFRYLNFIS